MQEEKVRKTSRSICLDTACVSKRHLFILLLLFLWGCTASNDGLFLSGNLETYDLDQIAPFTAELLALKVQEGDTVAPGDTLAILDTVRVAAAYAAARAAEEEARARLADLEAGSDKEKIRAAEARLEIARANHAQSERDLRRFDSLFAEGLIDAQTQERARLDRDNAVSSLKDATEKLADLKRGARTYQIEEARAALQRAAADVAARRRDYEQVFLISDHYGVVQLLPYQIGELVPVGRAAVTVRNPDDLWAFVYVPEDRLSDIAVGDTTRFTVDAFDDRVFKGTVSYIAAAAEFTPRNVQTPDERLNLVFAVKVVVSPGQKGLRAGMPADFVFE